MPFVIGKCISRSRTSTSGSPGGVAHASLPGGRRRRRPTRAPRPGVSPASRRAQIAARRSSGSRHACWWPGSPGERARAAGRCACAPPRRTGSAGGTRSRGGLLISDGGRPGIGTSGSSLRCVEARDRLQQAPGVRVLRRGEDRLLRPLLDDPARVHHGDVVGDLGDHAEVVGDQHDRRVELALQAVEQLEDLRLDGHVERRRRLVGDQQLRVVDQPHRDHHALAHAAGELVRVAVDAAARLGDADQAEHLDGAVERLRLADVAVRADRLDQLVADLVEGMQRADSGSWKIIAISLPRMSRSSSSSALSRSRPSNRTSPLIARVRDERASAPSRSATRRSCRSRTRRRCRAPGRARPCTRRRRRPGRRRPRCRTRRVRSRTSSSGAISCTAPADRGRRRRCRRRGSGR